MMRMMLFGVNDVLIGVNDQKVAHMYGTDDQLIGVPLDGRALLMGHVRGARAVRDAVDEPAGMGPE